MKRGAVLYRDSWLLPGSRALELHVVATTARDPKERVKASSDLEKHAKRLDQEFRARGEAPQ